MSVTPIVPSSPRRAPSRRWAGACAPALLALALPAAQAQLIDGGFDINPLTTIAAVINTPNLMVFGQWGQESATVVGPVGLVVPSSPPFMLSTTATGGVTSQTVQAIDVLPWASMINSTSGANFTLSAGYNSLRVGPVGGIAMQFFSSNDYASVFGPPVSDGVSVDGIPAGWQRLSISGLIPQGTQSMMAQVYYVNSSLVQGQAAFIDAVEFEITPVPEPGSWALLAAGVAWLGWRSRRQAAQRA